MSNSKPSPGVENRILNASQNYQESQESQDYQESQNYQQSQNYQLVDEDYEDSNQREVITDSEGEDEFIRKYGEIQFQYIKSPKDAAWFIRPHALNYFKDGVLYRTKNERTSAKTELFLDLMYVGIIANLAGQASEAASGIALLKYVLFFVPAWTVWADIKDFSNYYYNEDLSQKLYIFWILVLLTFYVNSLDQVTEGRVGAAMTIVPYILCRLSLCVSLLVYSFYIPEHRPQQRLYSSMIFVTCCLWIPVIFVSTRAKIGMAIAIMVLEQLALIICFHPRTKKLMGLTMSTALNIEHDVERFGVFVTIAIGEFLYKVVATGPLGAGFTSKFARGVFLVWIAYVLFWIYNNGSTTKKATHALRYSAFTAITWIYSHLPLVAALVLAADAGGDLCEFDNTDLSKPSHEVLHVREEAEHPNMYALSFFFTGGICVSLLCMCTQGFLDYSHDSPELFIIPRFWRVIWRAPVGIVIVVLSFAELDSTLLMGIITILLTLLLVFESITSTPQACLVSLKNNVRI
jgi:low temperature requirement protein LtrA